MELKQDIRDKISDALRAFNRTLWNWNKKLVVHFGELANF